MPHATTKFSRANLAAMLFCALAGCLVGPAYHTPPALEQQQPPDSYKESPDNFKETGNWKIAQPRDAALRVNWWEIFNDPELNALEAQVIINNQNIKQFFQNFMESRAIIGETQSQLYPTVTLSPGYTWSRSPSSGGFVSTGNGQGVSGSAGRFATVPFGASWEIDLWGKIRNAINAAAYTSQINAADLANEELAEQSNLAVFFFEIRGQDALLKLYKDTIAYYQKQVDYTRSQYQTGIGDEISVVEAENTLQNAQAAATNLEIARAQFEHAIAVLIGKTPSSFSIPVRPEVTAPPPIPIGVPSRLLERRPDIAAAERQMAAANAQIGVAYTAYYPDLTISAAAGFESPNIGSLFNWPNRFWSIGPTVSETLFDAGLRTATVHQFIATYNADLATYRQTVLTAFQQVEDNLASVRILSHELDQQNQAVKSAETFVRLELSRYQTGIDPYVDVVTTQTTLLSDQQTLLTLKVQQLTSATQLVAALGGGWDNTQLPTTRQISQRPTTQETAIQK
jgi:NodT family efflux transporter outer membrane factor (OMF) lipoprotein